MTLSFSRTFLIAILLTCVSCCVGCRDNSRVPSKPAEQDTDSSAPENAPNGESARETPPKQSVQNRNGAEKADSESTATEEDAGQSNNSESNGSSGAGNQATGSSGQGTGLGKPGVPASAASDSSSANNGVAQPTFSSPEFKTADAALTYAKRQREASSKLFDNGDTAESYEKALQGWQALQSHLANKECGNLSGDLLADLEKYGEQLGSKGISIIGKPLKIK